MLRLFSCLSFATPTASFSSANETTREVAFDKFADGVPSSNVGGNLVLGRPVPMPPAAVIERSGNHASRPPEKALNRAQKKIYESLMFVVFEALSINACQARIGQDCLRFGVFGSYTDFGSMQLGEVGALSFASERGKYNDLWNAYRAASARLRDAGVRLKPARLEGWTSFYHGNYNRYVYRPGVLILDF